MSGETEAARTRRRWVTLAEVVAVSGLLIGGANLFVNWQGRQEDHAAKVARSAAAARSEGVTQLTGRASADGSTITLADGDHSLTAASIRFPADVADRAYDAMPGPAVRADWVAERMLTLTDKGTDERSGRLPALITVTWWQGDVRHRDTALYDVMWRTEGRMMRGRRFALTGLALSDRVTTVAALDAAWKRVRPS